MMAGSKTLRSKGRIQMCEISNLQISQIQLATHGRSIQMCHFQCFSQLWDFDRHVGALRRRRGLLCDHLALRGILVILANEIVTAGREWSEAHNALRFTRYHLFDL